MTRKTFASDNYSGVHPEITEALVKANSGHAPSYGADEYTTRAVQQFRQYFGDDIEVFFVYNGTGANVLGLSAGMHSFNSVVCADLAHINVDESTASEKFIGCKLITIPTHDGKIRPHEIESRIRRVDDQHHPQAKIISISQPTEYGTVYTVAEIESIAEVAKKYNLLLHMDGARISNAAVALAKDFRAFTRQAGVDILSFGGTKNGMMFGEAVIFFNTTVSENFMFIRKQGMQLHSKMRFISAQFEALLSNNLWERSARHANTLAKLLESRLGQVPGIKITQKVDANSVFAVFPAGVIPELQKAYFFYLWDERINEVRLMCSFDTTEDDVEKFVIKLKDLVEQSA